MQHNNTLSLKATTGETLQMDDEIGFKYEGKERSGRIVGFDDTKIFVRSERVLKQVKFVTVYQLDFDRNKHALQRV